MVKNLSINLLSKEKFERTKIGRMVIWTTTIGRYLVIGTELIVIAAFLSRFYLDRVLTDLNEELNQKQSVIESFSDLENRVETTQQRINLVKKLLAGQMNINQQLTKIGQSTPKSVAFENLSFDSEQVQIDGTALSKQAAASFLSALKTNQNFTNLNVNKLSSKSNQADVEFSLSINLESDND